MTPLFQDFSDAAKRAARNPAVAAALAGIAIAGCNPPPAGDPQDSSAGSSAMMEASSAMMEASSAMMEESAYRDGTFAATGNYTSPAGVEEVEITLTLQNGLITDATFTGKATHPTSMKLQGMFAEGFHEVVVGKDIDELSLTVVNGSSLAPKGFMDAVAKIKAEAQA